MTTKKEIDLHSAKQQLTAGRSARNQCDVYKEILTSINAIVFIFDLVNFRLIWANNGFKKMLGYKKPVGDIPEEVMLDIYHPDDRDLLIEMKNFFEKNRKGTFLGIYQFKNVKNEYIWLCTSANLLRKSKDGKVFEVVGVSINFTENITYDRNLKIIAREKAKESNADAIGVLSKREQELIRYFANGHKTKDVADMLNLSYHTVNNHRKNMIKKLGVKNVAGLVNFAMEHGLH